ncbi:MAG: hypothetical protein WBH90_01890 [Aggregatilineales bacterium]|nr:hypothetical protein [Aggregatilineales bacterium]
MDEDPFHDFLEQLLACIHRFVHPLALLPIRLEILDQIRRLDQVVIVHRA